MSGFTFFGNKTYYLPIIRSKLNFVIEAMAGVFNNLNRRYFCVVIFIISIIRCEFVSNKIIRLSPLYCGLVPKELPVRNVIVQTVLDCARECDGNATCTGFFFNDDDDACSVYNTTFNLMSFERKQGTEAYELVSGVSSDCYDVTMNGDVTNGIYYIVPRDNGAPIKVLCELETNGGGWLVIQQRTDGSEDFYRTWNEYKDGFGDLNHEFWLGNTNIHRLTSQGLYDLRIDLEDFDGSAVYAVYRNFSLAAEENYFQLRIGQYSGNAGNSLASHNGFYFTTKDRNHGPTNDTNCAEVCIGAWWYSLCHVSNLNGFYVTGNKSAYPFGMTWTSWRGSAHSLKTSAMKIKPSFGNL